MEQYTAKRPLDRRQRKSREAIQNALLELLREKPLEQITISELSIKADVNRKTFYNNYHNISEVRDELHNYYLDQIFSLIREKRPSIEASGSLEDFFCSFCRGLRDRQEQLLLILDCEEHLSLTKRLKDTILPYLQRNLPSYGPSTALLPYLLEYIIHGLAAIINLWLHSTPQMSDEDFAHLAAALVRSTIHSFE